MKAHFLVATAVGAVALTTLNASAADNCATQYAARMEADVAALHRNLLPLPAGVEARYRKLLNNGPVADLTGKSYPLDLDATSFRIGAMADGIAGAARAAARGESQKAQLQALSVLPRYLHALTRTHQHLSDLYYRVPKAEAPDVELASVAIEVPLITLLPDASDGLSATLACLAATLPT